MKFHLPFYRFSIFKTVPDEIYEVCEENVASLHKAHVYKKHFLSQRISCDYSHDVVESLFQQNCRYYHSPTLMSLVFTPKTPVQLSVFIRTGFGISQDVFGKHNQSLEMLDIRFSTHNKSPDGIREICYYRGTELIRMVRVMIEVEPKWELCLIGEQQPFEEEKSYEKVKRKRIKEYFTMEDLIRFATNWGAPINQDDFWDSDHPMHRWGYLECESAEFPPPPNIDEL